MPSHLIDPFEFCKNNEMLEGCTPVSETERLLSVCTDTSGELVWKVSGSLNVHQQPELLLDVAGQVSLMCQRCLEPFVFDLRSETTVMVAKTEEEADEMEEALSDEDAVEVIVAEGKIDVMDLVEDEALLALPLSPRHEVCPAAAVKEWKETRESPVSARKGLKIKQ